MKDVILHYDRLIEENNDPLFDAEPLKKYMDKWDGERFIESMSLDKSKSVLEIGVGTGRLAVRVIDLCKSFCGIDISPKTVARASENLKKYKNASFICGDFLSHDFSETFDVIYSSLTFMHFKDKRSAVRKAASLLNKNGLFVLSVSKDRSEYIDMGTRKIKVYPDNVEQIRDDLLLAGLRIDDEFETEFAYVTVGRAER